MARGGVVAELLRSAEFDEVRERVRRRTQGVIFRICLWSSRGAASVVKRL